MSVGGGPAAPSARVAPRYADATWQDWGTYVFLGVADADALPAARTLVRRSMAEFELAISRFRPDSDLMRANAGAGDWVDVGDLLVEAVQVALGAAHDTDGLVDPTMGLLLGRLGYDDDLEAVRRRPAGPADPAALPAPPLLSGAWQRVRTAPGRVLVPAATALDLGATGKAFAADRISARVAAEVGVDCILSLGGDVAVAHTTDHPPHGWQVSVSERPDDPVTETVALPRGGAATSTTTHRTWQRGPETMHHLLDPATGRPVKRTWRTASVLAPDCVTANTASTAALVLGERAEAWLARRGLAARLVTHDGGHVTRLGAWPAPAA